MAADGKKILQVWEDLKALKTARESEFQAVADYFLPRKDFSCTPTPGQLRKRRVATNVGSMALQRAAALFLAYAIDPAQPFLTPNVSRGLAQAGRAVYVKGPDGRRLDLDGESRDYLDDLRWQVFDAQMLPQSGFLTSMSRAALEFLGFGNCVVWGGRKRGFGPRWQHRDFRSCWFAENEDGEIDTLYYRFVLPAWRVAQRYPGAVANDNFKKLVDDPKKNNTPVTLLHAVEPRESGVVGAVSTNKPFLSATVLPDFDGHVAKEEGYDDFPYSVARMNVEEGSVYGTGMGWLALPDVMAINHFSGGLERSIDLINDPVLFTPARLFGNKLDRRPGAANVYDPVNLGFQNLKDAIQKAEIAGDPSWAERRIAVLTQNVEQVFLVDWMRLRDSGNMTAEEVRERRDLRIRALSFLVPAFDRDLFGRGADRGLAALIDEGLVRTPPAMLGGVDVDWDYAGPLAMAQKLTQVDGVLRLFDAARMAKEFDETAGDVLAVEEGLRAVSDALGNAPGIVRSRAAVQELREQRQAAAEQQQENEAMTAQATALRDAGQGIASIENAGQPEQMAA